MKIPKREAVVSALAFVLFSAAGAEHARAQEPAHTYFCQVAQPMVARDDRRIEIHDVTYALKLHSPVPGAEIKYTCFPGPVVVRGADPADTVNTSDIGNLNAANLLGLKIRVESRPPGTWNVESDTSGGSAESKTRFFVEKLEVNLDVGALIRQRRHASDPQANRGELAQFDALVAATVECILDNARRSQPPVRKVQLNVVGWNRYRHLTDVYEVKEPSPRKQYSY